MLKKNIFKHFPLFKVVFSSLESTKERKKNARENSFLMFGFTINFFKEN